MSVSLIAMPQRPTRVLLLFVVSADIVVMFTPNVLSWLSASVLDAITTDHNSVFS